MRRISLLFAAAVALALVLTPGVAFANFKIHGGYTDDTDACAGCHRAHTSVSSITWNDGAGVDENGNGTGTDHSALLVSNATEIYQFCYACHGNDAQGAETNVEGGIYDGTAYGTHGAALNGGFFGDKSAFGQTQTSSHAITGSWGAYGGGLYGKGLDGATGIDPIMGTSTGTGNQIAMSCASCHDPHGSSNYRLLADKVNGNAVGGYASDGAPTPYVISNEPGYPNGTGGRGMGWQKQGAGQAQMNAYTPSYTSTAYAKAPGGNTDTAKGMSGWCAGCHSEYTQTGTPHQATDSVYDAGDGWYSASRHRHPMNVSVDSQSLTVKIDAPNVPLPLAHDPGAANANVGTDWIDCMTCHVAHGASTIMTGYANVADARNIEPNSGTVKNGSGGTQPTGDSALLRRDNRGVCEVCHNK